MRRKKDQLKLLALLIFLAGLAVYLITDNFASRTVHAYSSGPPAGFTHAPGEFDCAECHLPQADAGTGHISISAPQSYVPGQTYQITVTHTNADPTRLRWGFQLTALDDSNSKAGNLQNLDVLTQVLDNQGPGASRQYIEHTASGTFINQQGGASWTFSWTAPQTNVGPVTFYVAGNQANNDGNTSGDYIYFTFAQTQAAQATADFSVTATPATRTVAPGSGAAYDLTVTPTSGFTGQVTLGISGLPTGASANFNPTSVSIMDANAKSSTLTVTTSAGTPVGTYPLTVTATNGSTQHTTVVSLKVVTPTSADISLTATGSPNPAAVATALSYRLTATNNGPATATSVSLTDNLPATVSFVSAATTQGSCAGTGPVICNLGSLASGASAVVTINVTPNTPGQITNTASVSATEADSDNSNNTVSVNTVVDPQVAAPLVLDQNLAVKTIVSNLNQPTSMAFLGADEFLILEKATGKVQRVFNGQLQGTALDLAVNNASERGLLGIALHPNFPATPWVYLYWTESSTNVDTSNTDDITLLGNRVDRFVWNGATLTLDRNIIRLRALQADAGQPSRGNHNGGVLRFGPDGKLYIIIGDNGRRGLLQNITSGGPVPDDQFGGPEPDDAHLTGVILRLNDDGATPSDNPFFNAATNLTGQAAANIKKVYAYGVRNGFGMAFDPLSGNLWTQENGDDAFDEINRVTAGFNGGWIQVMGPSSRVQQYKEIETGRPGGLQQNRWSPTLIADTPAEALSRLYMLPGSEYREPEFSWKYAVAPSPIGFVRGNSLGAQFNGDMFVGASRTTLYNGYLFRMKLSNDRLKFSPTDSRLQDGVADNLDKFDITESESLLIGKNFGITTDIQTGPDGNLYVVSLSNGAVYQIFANNNLQLAASGYTVGEADGSAKVIVNRTGNTAGAVRVDYTTSDTSGLNQCSSVTGQASSRCDYATTTGTLQFAAGETSKTIFIPLVDDGIADGTESFTLRLSNAAGANLGTTSTATITITDNEAGGAGPNPIDQTPFFVRQQYIDFLGREPDPAGLQGWQDILNNCGTTVAQPCDRIEVSAGFFRSEEFQSRGYFIYRFYSAVGKIPLYEEFMPDFAKVSGFLSPQQLEDNKAAFVNEFMTRADFRTLYGSLSDPTAYVNALLNTVGLPNHGSRQTWINGLTNGTMSRGQVLRALVESVEVYTKYYNEAFVIMQYFGYLRRSADISYLQWIQTMNQTNGDYRTMINGFLNSLEYRQRFGP
ncbi:MAG TPA: PQQ-dependent sugar dehydrogenase [Pyrinomonadaceae bacterium]|nr:PQQ-dependent sugar dehydrogenase [Pyrinomonadaceae bacterium]